MQPCSCSAQYGLFPRNMSHTYLHTYVTGTEWIHGVHLRCGNHIGTCILGCDMCLFIAASARREVIISWCDGSW